MFLIILFFLFIVGIAVWRKFFFFKHRKHGEIKNKYGQWALVTGASSGIGKDFAKRLAEDGISVILSARRVNELEALAKEIHEKYNVEARVIQADLGKHGGAHEFIAQLRKLEDIDLGLLINNAGFGLFETLHDTSNETIEQMIELNVTSVALLAKYFVERATLRTGSHHSAMVITSSLASYFPSGYTALYSATKAFDAWLAIGVNAELAHQGKKIEVVSLDPGATITEFGDVAKVESSGRTTSRVTSDFVAVRTLDAMAAGRTVVLPNNIDYAMTYLAYILPREWVGAFAGRVAFKMTQKK